MKRLTSSELAVVCAELGVRKADLQTRIRAAEVRYGENRSPCGAARMALQLVGMLCVIAATWRGRRKRWRSRTTTTR